MPLDRVMGADLPEIKAQAIDSLESYGNISIAFNVRSRLNLDALKRGEFIEIPVMPFWKNYDAHSLPAEWSRRFDVRNWIQLSGPHGSAIVAWNTLGVDMLEDRSDLAVLWDLRVSQEARGQGLGKALVDAAVAWARERGCIELKVETQDINVAACRFYSAMGFQLASVEPEAYPGLDEAMLIWRRRI